MCCLNNYCYFSTRLKPTHCPFFSMVWRLWIKGAIYSLVRREMGKGTGISICSLTDRQVFSSSLEKELNVTRPTYSLIVHLSVLNLLTTAALTCAAPGMDLCISHKSGRIAFTRGACTIRNSALFVISSLKTFGDRGWHNLKFCAAHPGAIATKILSKYSSKYFLTTLTHLLRFWSHKETPCADQLLPELFWGISNHSWLDVRVIATALSFSSGILT